MDCFVEGPNFLAIDPETCIDCSVCVPQCPVDAIVNASEADAAQRPFIELNARFARDPRWTPITRSKPPLSGRREAEGIGNKTGSIEPPV